MALSVGTEGVEGCTDRALWCHHAGGRQFLPELSQLGGNQSLFVHRLFLESCRGANSPELFLPPWAKLTGHRLEPEGARVSEGQMLLALCCVPCCAPGAISAAGLGEPLCDQVKTFRCSEPTAESDDLSNGWGLSAARAFDGVEKMSWPQAPWAAHAGLAHA